MDSVQGNKFHYYFLTQAEYMVNFLNESRRKINNFTIKRCFNSKFCFFFFSCFLLVTARNPLIVVFILIFIYNVCNSGFQQDLQQLFNYVFFFSFFPILLYRSISLFFLVSCICKFVGERIYFFYDIYRQLLFLTSEKSNREVRTFLQSFRVWKFPIRWSKT